MALVFSSPAYRTQQKSSTSLHAQGGTSIFMRLFCCRCGPHCLCYHLDLWIGGGIQGLTYSLLGPQTVGSGDGFSKTRGLVGGLLGALEGM